MVVVDDDVKLTCARMTPFFFLFYSPVAVGQHSRPQVDANLLGSATVFRVLRAGDTQDRLQKS